MRVIAPGVPQGETPPPDPAVADLERSFTYWHDRATAAEATLAAALRERDEAERERISERARANAAASVAQRNFELREAAESSRDAALRLVEAEIAKIEADERWRYPPATTDVNAGLALTQVAMKAGHAAFGMCRDALRAGAVSPGEERL